MTRAALLLALWLVAPASAWELAGAGKGQTLAASGTLQFAFTPGDDADDMIIEAIRAARKQILVQAFSFTHQKIARALVAAKQNGVDVQLIADAKQTERIGNSAIAKIAAGGVAVYLDDRHQSAHNKVLVIDAGTPQAAIVTGSYNFTHAAQFTNAENVLLLRGNAELTAAYLKNWQRHRAHALPYQNRRN